MPTYLYHCIDCGESFEEFQSITDKPLDRCRKCGGRAERVITGGAGFLFKGSGFYITEHRSEGYRKAEAKDKPSTSSPAPKTTESTKPAEKTPKPS